jgi:hypothetical protein
MLIYTHQFSNRLTYITRVLLENEGVVYRLTNNIEEFKNYNNLKICYSNNNIDASAIHIVPHGLLHENGIKEQAINFNTWKNLPVFFCTNGHLPFDIFAAAFYLITRYEEYLPHTLDEYKRYAHTNSLAFKHNFLHLPLVNLWITKFIEAYNIPAKNSSFTFIPTYDIDIAFAYQHQPIIKNIGGFFKNLLQANITSIEERIAVLANKTKDPFDIYDWLQQLHQQHHLQPIYFFLVANKNSRYDKNLPPQTTAFKQLIKKIAQNNTVGIHPSWQSNVNPVLCLQEINTLQHITQTNCTLSRQHYIKLSLPQTYEQLIQAGITHDYSMGYGSINGFRASYTKPFYWYNLPQENITTLTIHPFCYMDANSIFEEKLNIETAYHSLYHYYTIVKQVQGTCIVIHHNHFLTEQPAWVNWRKMYEQFLQAIAN